MIYSELGPRNKKRFWSWLILFFLSFLLPTISFFPPSFPPSSLPSFLPPSLLPSLPVCLPSFFSFFLPSFLFLIEVLCRVTLTTQGCRLFQTLQKNTHYSTDPKMVEVVRSQDFQESNSIPLPPPSFPIWMVFCLFFCWIGTCLWSKSEFLLPVIYS